MIPIILCGGSGLRLWPVSNKLFHDFFEHSLFEMTLKRLKRHQPFIIVGRENLKPYIKKSLERQNCKADLIFEPESKNTAVAVALACHFLRQRRKQNDIVGIFPSDHIIRNESVFHDVLTVGAATAMDKEEIITLGLKPSRSATGYGWIKTNGSLGKAGRFPLNRVVGFVEKPDSPTRERFLKEGWLCNSGIFLCRTDVLNNCFENCMPDLWKKISQSGEKLSVYYRELEPISFDKGIMEKTSRRLCLACPDMGLMDQGSWDHIAEGNKKFPGSLKNKACVVSEDCEGNFVFSSHNQTVGLIGIKDSLIIKGEKGLLVMKKGLSEKVKETAEQIKAVCPPENSRMEERPWGCWRVIEEGESFKCKILLIKPAGRLSYQSHQKRMEHWVVISGTAQVTLEGKEIRLSAGEHILIPKEAKHRLANLGKGGLTVLEIQMGDDLNENDIIRHRDEG